MVSSHFVNETIFEVLKVVGVSFLKKGRNLFVKRIFPEDKKISRLPLGLPSKLFHRVDENT